MPLFLKRHLSEDKFYDGFDNTAKRHYTLLCFQLKEDSKIIFKLWGYAINDERNSHAEELVINELEPYIEANISHDLEKYYNITLYLSFSPCSRCCRKIIDFHRKCNSISIDIKMSKSYYVQCPVMQNSLKNLLKENISLKVMDKHDFDKCFYLFVEGGHEASFKPWFNLESCYQEFSGVLHTLQFECEKTREIEEKQTEALENSTVPSGIYHSNNSNLHDPFHRTPEKDIEEEASVQSDSSQKIKPPNRRQGNTVQAKRALFKD